MKRRSALSALGTSNDDLDEELDLRLPSQIAFDKRNSAKQEKVVLE